MKSEIVNFNVGDTVEIPGSNETWRIEGFEDFGVSANLRTLDGCHSINRLKNNLTLVRHFWN